MKTMMLEQNRLTSKVVWLAVVAQIVGLLIVLGVIDTGMGQAVNAVASSVCELLVLFGILNNPTSAENF